MTNILTLHLDPDSQAFFERQRQQHFPPNLNQIPAHLTLFHALPDTGEIHQALLLATRREPFPVTATGLRSLGKGVAYTIRSAGLLALHANLATAFADHLIPQDKQRFTPHIVVQNKVTPAAARALLTQLERTFHQLEATATGLDLWHYLGGPWQLAQTYPFARL